MAVAKIELARALRIAGAVDHCGTALKHDAKQPPRGGLRFESTRILAAGRVVGGGGDQGGSAQAGALQPVISTTAPISPAQTDLWTSAALFLLWTIALVKAGPQPPTIRLYSIYAGDAYGQIHLSGPCHAPYWQYHARLD